VSNRRYTIRISTEAPINLRELDEFHALAGLIARTVGCDGRDVFLEQDGTHLVAQVRTDYGAAFKTAPQAPAGPAPDVTVISGASAAVEPETYPVPKPPVSTWQEAADALNGAFEIPSDWFKPRVIRVGQSVVGWWSQTSAGAKVYVLKDGTVGGPVDWSTDLRETLRPPSDGSAP
jgi:hypothetical protein